MARNVNKVTISVLIAEAKDKKRVNIENCVMCNEDLDSLVLIGLDAKGATFVNCKFTNIDFSSAWFIESTFIMCKFEKCRLNDLNLNYSTIKSSEYHNCFFGKSDMSNVQIYNSKFFNCDFRLTEITHSIIVNSVFIFLEWPNILKMNPFPKVENTYKINTVWNEATR